MRTALRSLGRYLEFDLEVVGSTLPCLLVCDTPEVTELRGLSQLVSLYGDLSA